MDKITDQLVQKVIYEQIINFNEKWYPVLEFMANCDIVLISPESLYLLFL